MFIFNIIRIICCIKIGFIHALFSFRGDKKTICNKFVQTVSKDDQVVSLKPAKSWQRSVDEDNQRSMINSENTASKATEEVWACVLVIPLFFGGDVGFPISNIVLTVLQTAVTCLLWPSDTGIVYGLVEGKVRFIISTETDYCY